MLTLTPAHPAAAHELCCYTNAPRTWIPGETVTASMMNGLRDLFLEIEGGTAELDRATFVGKTSATLAGSLSAAGQAALAYDTDLGVAVLSVNGGAFTSLGGFVLQTTSSTGTVNNFSLNGPRTYLTCTGSAPLFNGFSVGGAAPNDGDMFILDCLGTTAQVAYDAGASTAANRMYTPSVQGQIVGQRGRMWGVYDGAADRWRVTCVDPGAPIAFTPTWTGSGTNPAIVNGTLSGLYTQRGRFVRFEVYMIAGSSTTFGSGTYVMGLPPLVATGADSRINALTGSLVDSGTARYVAVGAPVGTTTWQAWVDGAVNALAATYPFTWVASDSFQFAGEYQIS